MNLLYCLMTYFTVLLGCAVLMIVVRAGVDFTPYNRGVAGIGASFFAAMVAMLALVRDHRSK
jgi:hypothetical protein